MSKDEMRFMEELCLQRILSAAEEFFRDPANRKAAEDYMKETGK